MARVLFVEASSGGVVGGSLSGLYHLIRGMDRDQFQVGMVLYERKGIEPDLADLGVQVYHVHRRRLRKEHALLQSDGYRRAKRVGAVRSGLQLGRQTLRLLAEDLPAAAALARVIRRERADVVHLGNGLRANFDGILACLLTRTPMRLPHQGVREVQRPRALGEPAHGHGRVHDARHPRLLQGAGHASRVRRGWSTTPWTRNGWSRRARPRRCAPSSASRPSALCVGILGNIQEWKGQRVVVEAMAKIAAEHPTAHCLIVGGVHRAGEEYAAALRRRCSELGLDGRVHFVGFREDVPDVIHALDVVVHASVRPEPFGRVILEGMLMGKPVVATAAGGVTELIEDGETGFLVPPGDVDALAQRLHRLLAAPDLRRAVGTQARVWARQRSRLAAPRGGDERRSTKLAVRN